MAAVARVFAVCLLAAVPGACTAIGVHDPTLRTGMDFGARDSVALCLYLDAGISEPSARALVQEAWAEDAALYGLEMRVVRVVRWHRPAFTGDGILDALRQEPLPPGCDRILALVGRHLGDVLWGMTGLPEVLGAVNDETLTHGYAVVRWASLNQVFAPPRAVVRHELYHLLGCDRHFDMARCYAQIARLKRLRRETRSDFFPAWDLVNQRVLDSREAVNARLGLLTGVSAGAAAR